MNFGDLKPVLDKIISVLTKIERHTGCSSCATPTTLVVDNTFNDEAANYAYITTGGVAIGAGVMQDNTNDLQDLLAALNSEYDGIATFVYSSIEDKIIVIFEIPVQNPGFVLTEPL